MLTLNEKETLWKKASKEFPSDPMLRDLHFIRALMTLHKRRARKPRKHKELGLLAREEFIEWLKVHPEFAEE